MIWLRRLLLLLVALLLVLSFAIYIVLRESLPILNGDIEVGGLKAGVRVDRDNMGVPVITGQNREDVAYATGYLHAQERFFQLDLSRRHSAGEISELVGEAALDHDRRMRRHRFRNVARDVVEAMAVERRKLLEAYAVGVNQGLADLGAKPFEYFLLGTNPVPWRPEDTFLTVFSMYLDLNDHEAALDDVKGYLNRVTSKEVIDFLSPLRTRWDAPLQEGDLPRPTLPGREKVNLRVLDEEHFSALSGSIQEDVLIGSNSWAVSGQLTRHGGAIVENDMHLEHRVPTIWYRVQFHYPHPVRQGETVSVTGLTLPGAPLIVVGSNGRVAWGLTNSFGDWVDLVELETSDPDHYLTPQGAESFTRWIETIGVKGQGAVEVEYQATRWGPVVESRYDTTKYALRWTAHNPEATNFKLAELETVTNVYEAMEVANGSGIPPQNFTTGDRQGNIAWTIAGRIPTRSGLDSTFPLSWQAAESNWKDWLPVGKYPRVVNPETNRIWTANARIAGGEDLLKIGNGGYALGPRQEQIRDALMQLEAADEQSLLNLALDHRALYLENWRRLILDTLSKQARDGQSGRQIFHDLVQNWSGKAAVDDAGYRLVREYHDALKLKILQSLGRYFLSLSSDVRDEVEDGYLQNLHHETEMMWRLLDQRPSNWLNPKYGSWEELLLETVDEVITQLGGADALKGARWGQRNRAEIRHPLSRAIPVIGKLLDMPAVPLEGDAWMPRAQRSGEGVSERMIVSPGYEKEGIFHMPGGQSGHPLSPFYETGYMDWVEGQPTPFLPGQARHSLTLHPVQ